MQLTGEDIVTILKLFEESNFDSLQLECGDLKLVVTMNGCTLDQEQAVRVDQKPVINAAVTPASGPTPDSGSAQASGKVSATDAEVSEAVEDGLVVIKAPMVGTFYARPEPGAEPFVGLGSKVSEDSAVGIIEVMKVFSSIVAGVKGVITKILVEDAQFVEYGQPLFLVRPEGEQAK